MYLYGDWPPRADESDCRPGVYSSGIKTNFSCTKVFLQLLSCAVRDLLTLEGIKYLQNTLLKSCNTYIKIHANTG